MDTYIITGASGGIGSGIAKKLAKDGYSLILCGNKNEKALTDTLRFCEKYTACCSLQGNLCDAAFVKQVIDKAIHGGNRIGGLVHCAGISRIELLSDMAFSEWQNILNVNLSSAFLLCKELTPQLVSQKEGRILLISSVWGNRGASCEVAYSASKGGINSFTKALAKELAPSGIAVNALAPGLVDTAMNHVLTQEELQAVIDEIPACRMTNADEIGEMVSLLLRAPVYLTGQIIGFDGGWE